MATAVAETDHLRREIAEGRATVRKLRAKANRLERVCNEWAEAVWHRVGRCSMTAEAEAARELETGHRAD